jgi:hypothetical protein
MVVQMHVGLQTHRAVGKNKAEPTDTAKFFECVSQPSQTVISLKCTAIIGTPASASRRASSRALPKRCVP